MKYAIFLYDPDGDMGEAIIVGLFTSFLTAISKAEKIRELGGQDQYQNDKVEVIVAPVYKATITPEFAVETMREH
jgi:hypothetical protein